MDDTEHTIEHLLEYAIEIEYKAAHIYGTLSKLFPQVPGLTAFWQGLKEDELEHANILHETRNLMTPEQLLQDPGRKAWKDMGNLQLMLSKDLLATVNTLEDAYQLAYDLEFSEVNTIFQFLTVECIPSGKTKQLINSMIDRHLNKISEFNQTFGDKDWRRGTFIHQIQAQ
jgi:rubrerythrin